MKDLFKRQKYIKIVLVFKISGNFLVYTIESNEIK